jgi:hypothetical protein
VTDVAIARSRRNGAYFERYANRADASVIEPPRAVEPDEIPELRPIGVARDYPELHFWLRQVAESRAISRETIDDISGLQPGYSAKLLAPVPKKALGRVSMGPLFGSLGLLLVVCEDPRQLARVSARYVRRDEKSAHAAEDCMEQIIRHRIYQRQRRAAIKAWKTRRANAEQSVRRKRRKA